MTNKFRMMVLFGKYDQNWNQISLNNKEEVLQHIFNMQAKFPEIVKECSQENYVVNFYSHQAFDENGKEVLKTVTTNTELLCSLQHYVIREVKIEVPGEEHKSPKSVFRLKQNADADCLAAALFFASSESIEFITNGFETDKLEELAETLPIANKKVKAMMTLGYETRNCSCLLATRKESLCEQIAIANMSLLKKGELATILLAGIFASGKTSNTNLIMDLIRKGADETKAKEFFK